MGHITKSKMGRVLLLCVLGVFGWASGGGAQTSVVGPSGPIRATVGSTLEFTLSRIVRMDADAGESDPFLQGTIISPASFDFGTLRAVSDNAGNVLYMRGHYYFYVLFIAATSGRRYKISETGTDLTSSGGQTLPRNAVLLIPDYQWLDELGGVAQGAPPSGAFLGPVTTVSDTDSLVYQSGTAGEGRLVRAIVAIGGPEAGMQFPSNYSLGHNSTTGEGTLQQFTLWQPVTPDQQAGDYTGTITFTLVLN